MDVDHRPNTRISAVREHEICAGHRVYGHESKCAHLHGHNYRFVFECVAASTHDQLDCIGRVIDFSVIKEKLCMWLENNWDHKFLLWSQDPAYDSLAALDPFGVVRVPFNPTAENMAMYIVTEIAPTVLPEGIVCRKVSIHETSKCLACFELLG